MPILIVLLLSLLIPVSLPASDISIRCARYSPANIDISSLTTFYYTLPIDEKEEQVRDWAFYGLLSSLGLKPAAITPLLDGSFPMRYRSLRGKYRFGVLPGRIACPASDDCVILVPLSEGGNKLLQGFLFDKARLSFDGIPARVHIFAYSADIASQTITTSYLATVKGRDLLTPEFGYFEKEIKDAADLTEFCASANDVTCLKFAAGNIILGGRKNSIGQSASLSFEAIATLYQAYKEDVFAENKRREDYERFIAGQYEDNLKHNTRLRKAIKAGQVKYSQIMAEIRRKIPYASLGNQNVGFSLDPLLDFDGISAEMKKLSPRYGAFSTELEAAADKVSATRDVTPLLRLRRKLVDSKNDDEKRLDEELQDAALRHTYQAARYDGKMKGTVPAMILFYTDLTAKLWALDINGLSPKNKIKGFVALSEIKVPKLYWDDFMKLSKTRLWFGVKQESFDVIGNSVIFEPVATRVYAASSDPLYPGKESEPNYQSGEFLGWWDRHFNAVADFEPYYYKLNQLQKWSCIMMLLKAKHSSALGFLAQAEVSRELDFESWYKNTNDIKNKTELPFIERGKFHSTTECFRILQSEGYPLMGRMFFISGGVSLASGKDIASKLSRLGVGRNSGRGYTGTASPGAAGKTSRGGRLTRAGAGTGRGAAAKKPALEKNTFGEFTVVADSGTIRLQWTKGEGAVMDDYVNTLAAMQDAQRTKPDMESMLRGLNETESVIRLESGKEYLIKSANLKDRWIYIEINPADKAAGFTAKAAGCNPDSDEFYAKAIASVEAAKLTSRLNGTRILP